MAEHDSNDEEQIVDEILYRWETAVERGETLPSVENLCRDHPSMIHRVGEAISKLQRADAVLGPDAKTVSEVRWTSQASPMPVSVGPYQIMEILGEGGMGTVYKAQQRAPLKRVVAVKVIKAGVDTAEVVARFAAEHQALARLEHPNVARVFDVGTTELGRPYFVMEYLPGQPITRFCDRNKFSIRQRLELFHQACDGITHAHIKAIIHRDIKASNVLAFMQDGKPMVKVIDFGIAKALTGDRLTDQTFNTGHGVVVGSYDSMSPEQADGSPDIDTRTDVYSLGVLLYELITGVKPFEGKTFAKAADAEIRRIIREVNPPRPSTRFIGMGTDTEKIADLRQSKVDQLSRDLKSDLEWIPLKAMRKQRQSRYASSLQLSQDIDNYLNGRPLIAGPESQIYRLRKFVTRNAAAVVVSGVVVCTLLLAAYGMVQWHASSTELQLTKELQNARDTARIQTERAKTIASKMSQAELFAQRGRWVESLGAYEAAADSGATDYRRILLGRVVCLQNLGRLSDARIMIDGAIHVHGELADDPVVMIRRGEVLWTTDPTQAEALLRAALQRGMPKNETAFGQGEFAVARGLLADTVPEANDQFQSAIAADPYRQDAVASYAILSTILGSSGAGESAAVWTRMFPDDPSARIVQSIQVALHGDNKYADILSKASIDPQTGSKLRADIGKIFKLRNLNKPVSISLAADLADLFLSGGQTGPNRFNLPLPKAMGLSLEQLHHAINLQLMAKSQGDAKSKIGEQNLSAAAEAYVMAEKTLPIGVIMLLRAEVLTSLKQYKKSATAFENAASAPSPIDISGSAHLGAALALLEANFEDNKFGPEATSDPRVALHLRQAAERGALVPGESRMNIAMFVLISGRRTADARALLDMWNKDTPNDPLAGVREAENEYLAGNYGTAIRILNDLEQNFPTMNFHRLEPMKTACKTAIANQEIDPPSEDAVILESNYAVSPKATAAPSTNR